MKRRIPAVLTGLALVALLLPTFSQLYTQPVEAAVPGLVTHLKFDNNSLDSAGGNDFTLRGTAAFSAQVAPVEGSTGSLYLDGGIESQALGGADLFNGWAGGTVSFWIRINAAAAQNWQNNSRHDLIHKYNILEATVFKNAAAQLILMTRHSDGTPSGTWVSSASPLPTDAWIHVATTHAGSSASIYLNGALAGSGPTGRTLGAASPDIFEISPYDGGFSGFVDDFRVYGRAISQAEAAELAGGAGTGTTNFTITASAGVGGTITPAGALSVATGSSQTFTISPQSGYQVSDVLVDGDSQGSVLTYTFTNVTANHSIAATFSPTSSTTHTISATVSGAGGSIVPSGNVTVPAGGSQSFSLAGTAGFQVADVVVDGSSVGAVTSYTFANAQADHVISAAFTSIPEPDGTFQITDQFVTGLNSPTAMAFAPDGRLFVTEQAGSIRIINASGQLLPTPFMTLSSVRSDGERGLLGIAFDPQFATNGYLYIFYSPGNAAVSRVSRVTANGDQVAANSETVLFEYGNFSGNHRGGDLHFGPDGKLYVALGDAGEPANAQSVSSFDGKILRLNSDGTIPADNPASFVNSSGATLTPPGPYRAIWAIGLRNPYRFSFQGGTGAMRINDVGAGAWEEVNIGEAGANYGWPTCEGVCSNPSTRNPIYVHVRGPDPDQGCAITGGAFYEGNQFPVEYRSSYFIVDYCNTWLRHVRPDNSWSALPLSVPSGAVDLKSAPDGSLYVLGHGAGVVSRITFVSNGTNRNPIARATASPTSGPAPLTVNFDGSTSSDPDGDTLTYSWEFGDGATGSGAAPSHTYSASGTYSARLTVSDGLGGSDEATVSIRAGSPPVASITSPDGISLFAAGDTVMFSGDATDPDEGTLPESAYSWTVLFHHGVHTHPHLGPIDGTTSGSFTLPTVGHTEDDVFYRIYLTVTDADGLQSLVTRDVLLKKSNVTLTSNVPGTQILLDGQPHSTPYTFVGVAGVQRTIGVDSPQTIGSQSYEFISWSNGGSRSQVISTPDTDTTFSVNMASAARALSVGDVSVVEGNAGVTSLVFTVSLDRASTQTVTVDYATADAVALAGADYAAAAGTLTFAPGITTRSVVVAVLGDTQFEADETFALSLSGATNASIATAQVTGTIVNDDIGLPGAPAILTASPGFGSATVSFTAPSSDGGSPIASYTATCGSGSQAGATSPITVGGLANGVPVTCTVFATNGAGNGPASAPSNGVTPNGPIVNITRVPPPATEGSPSGLKAFTFTLTRTGAAAAFSVTYTVSGDVVSGEDYSPVTGTVAFTAAQATRTVSVYVRKDTKFEIDEDLTLTLTGATNGASLGGATTGTTQVLNDDAAPRISIGSSTVAEGAVASFAVTLSNGSYLPVSVTATTADGTANGLVTAPFPQADYTSNAPAGTVVTFAAGATMLSQNVAIQTISDTVYEGATPETYSVSLGNAVNGTILNGAGIGEITDNEAIPAVSVSGGAGQAESVLTHAFTLALTRPSVQSISVTPVTVDGTASAAAGVFPQADYVALPGSAVTFAPGETSKTVNVTVIDDAIDEAVTETFTVQLTSLVNVNPGTLSRTGTINDNDTAPLLTLTAPAPVDEESGPAVFTIRLSAISGLPVSVNAATAPTPGTATPGVDYTATGPQAFSWAPGTNASQSFNVALLPDLLIEANETFRVSLSGNVNARFTTGGNLASATIVDNDSTPTLLTSGARVVKENAGARAQFNVASAPSAGEPR